MFTFLKSWRVFRWFAFLVSLSADGYVFYAADPFTPRSFVASGLGAVILTIVFAEIALHLSGLGRIRRQLDEGEVITYRTGLHLFDLLHRIRVSRIARLAVWIPVNLALLTTLFWVGWCLWWAGRQVFGPSWTALNTVYASLPNNGYVCAGYLPLLFSIPFILEHVSEWKSRQYTLITDTVSRDARLLISEGVLSYDMESVSLERTVTCHIIQNFWGTLFAIGTLELRETAGGTSEIIRNVWKPRALYDRIQHAINERRRARTAAVD